MFMRHRSPKGSSHMLVGGHTLAVITACVYSICRAAICRGHREEIKRARTVCPCQSLPSASLAQLVIQSAAGLLRRMTPFQSSVCDELLRSFILIAPGRSFIPLFSQVFSLSVSPLPSRCWNLERGERRKWTYVILLRTPPPTLFHFTHEFTLSTYFK